MHQTRGTYAGVCACTHTHQFEKTNTANQNILIPIRKVLAITRHKGSIKFAKLEEIFIITVHYYLTS